MTFSVNAYTIKLAFIYGLDWILFYYFKLENFKCIAWIKILLGCAFFYWDMVINIS